MTAGTTPVQHRRTWPGVDQVLLRATIPFGVLVFLVAADGAGATAPQWLQLGFVGLAGYSALRPDSAAGVLVLLVPAYLWATGAGSSPAPASAWILLGAAGLVVAHVAMLVAAQGPATMRVDRVAVRRWSGRAALLWSAALVAWGVALILGDLPDRRTVYAAGLLLLTLVLVGVAALVSSTAAPGHAAGRQERRRLSTSRRSA